MGIILNLVIRSLYEVGGARKFPTDQFLQIKSSGKKDSFSSRSPSAESLKKLFQKGVFVSVRARNQSFLFRTKQKASDKKRTITQRQF